MGTRVNHVYVIERHSENGRWEPTTWSYLTRDIARDQIRVMKMMGSKGVKLRAMKYIATSK